MRFRNRESGNWRSCLSGQRVISEASWEGDFHLCRFVSESQLEPALRGSGPAPGGLLKLFRILPWPELETVDRDSPVTQRVHGSAQAPGNFASGPGPRHVTVTAAAAGIS